MAPRLAMFVVAVALGGIAALAGGRVFAGSPTFWQGTAAVVYLGALLAVQLGYISRPGISLRQPMGYLALLALACLAYLPMLQFGKVWLGMPGFLAGSLLLVLRPVLSLPLFAVIVASVATVDLSGAPLGEPPFFTILYAFVSTLFTGLIVFGLSRMTQLVADLHASQGELARLAVADERLRFSRDVHDLLGLSLSAITLKSELTKRLMTDYPERAKEEISEVLDLSRKALADVRSVASGYRDLSLDEECRSARTVLTAADVEVQIERDIHNLPGPIGTALATVLREAITNVLRHSEAQWCEIVVRATDGEAVLDVINDGVSKTPLDAATPERTGSGIDNLSYRVRQLGGDLTAEAGPGGTHRLHVVIPLGGRLSGGGSWSHPSVPWRQKADRAARKAD